MLMVQWRWKGGGYVELWRVRVAERELGEFVGARGVFGFGLVLGFSWVDLD